MNNIDRRVVEAFGKEWARFDQSIGSVDLEQDFRRYFHVFPWRVIPRDAIGFDIGCGSGRWAKFVAQRVGLLHCIDPSEEALDVARSNLKGYCNCRFHLAGIDDIPIRDGTMDFGYALGVLHHLPNPEAGMAECVRKLKPGAPLLVYIYYAFDNRPKWFRLIWRLSDLFRRVICRLPFQLRCTVSEIIATMVYWPLARMSLLLGNMGADVDNMPLSAYRAKSFYAMRTDALDRFGTRIEHRFTAAQIVQMMKHAGLCNVELSEAEPYWCAVGYRA